MTHVWNHNGSTFVALFHQSISRQRPGLIRSVVLIDARFLLVCGVDQATIEIFSDSTPSVWIDAIPVGLDLVSVRVRLRSQDVWGENHVSDSVSVIDLSRHVTTAFFQ